MEVGAKMHGNYKVPYILLHVSVGKHFIRNLNQLLIELETKNIVTVGLFPSVSYI